MMRIAVTALLSIGLVLSGASAAVAQKTEIVVRVVSKGGKFVGTSMGGARIILRDADTGEILAQGVTSGSTGNTAQLMTEKRTRSVPLSDETSAKFVATLDLDRPRLIEVSAFGPLAQRQAAMHVSSTQWVVPGKDIKGGDGWLLELPGIAVDVLAPPTHIALKAMQKISLKANVVMMCGCPITPGGLWDANKFEVAAILRRDGALVRTVPLSYAGKTSQFAADLELKQKGTYEATVYAYDPANGNTGVDSVTFMVQ